MSSTALRHSPAADRAGLCRQGYRGHDAQNPRRVFISGQKRGVFGVIKRELRRAPHRAIIGHLKAEVTSGAATSKPRRDAAKRRPLSRRHNFRRILAWLRDFCRLILTHSSRNLRTVSHQIGF